MRIYFILLCFVIVATGFEECDRLRNPLNGAIYLVLDGRCRHIPNIKTFNNLFRSWKTKKWNPRCKRGAPLENGSKLVWFGSRPEVYLMTRRARWYTAGRIRHVKTSRTFKACNFNWRKVRRLSFAHRFLYRHLGPINV